ncbi:MAG: acyltransferase [Clostridia bacterium]|nr:acyltransferase [Clostridia bacterium]
MNLPEKLLRAYNKILWKRTTKKLKSIGSNSYVGPGFTLKGPQYISIGNNFKTGKNITIHTWKVEKEPELIIGNNVSMTKNSYISCANRITIGDGVLMGEGCFITDNSHGSVSYAELDIPPSKRKIWSKGEVHIGKNVWLGRNVCVMPDVEIGDYAIIGANSVVTHSIPPRSVVGGVPARVIKMLNDEQNS